MRRVTTTTQFRRDLKRARKRGKDLGKLEVVIDALAAGEPLPSRRRDHVLSGNYAGKRECHVEPDWLLIYEVTEEEVLLGRTGSHADLFE